MRLGSKHVYIDGEVIAIVALFVFGALVAWLLLHPEPTCPVAISSYHTPSITITREER